MEDQSAEVGAGTALFTVLYFLAIGWIIKIATSFFGWGHGRIARRKGWLLSLTSILIGAAILASLAFVTAVVVFGGGLLDSAGMQAVIDGYWWTHPAAIAVMVAGGIFDATKGRDALEAKTGQTIEQVIGE